MADDSQNTLNTLRAAFPAFNVSEVTRTSRQYEFTPKAPGVNAVWVDKFTDQFAKFRDENFPDTHGDYTFGIENVNQAGARSNAPGFRLDANSVDTYAGKFAQHRNGLANLTNSASDTIRNAQTQYNKAITDLQTTPKEIVVLLQSEIARLLALPEISERMAALGYQPVGSTSDECARHIATEATRWAKVIREAGIKVR